MHNRLSWRQHHCSLSTCWPVQLPTATNHWKAKPGKNQPPDYWFTFALLALALRLNWSIKQRWIECFCSSGAQLRRSKWRQELRGREGSIQTLGQHWSHTKHMQSKSFHLRLGTGPAPTDNKSTKAPDWLGWHERIKWATDAGWARHCNCTSAPIHPESNTRNLHVRQGTCSDLNSLKLRHTKLKERRQCRYWHIAMIIRAKAFLKKFRNILLQLITLYG